MLPGSATDSCLHQRPISLSHYSSSTQREATSIQILLNGHQSTTIDSSCQTTFRGKIRPENYISQQPIQLPLTLRGHIQYSHARRSGRDAYRDMGPPSSAMSGLGGSAAPIPSVAISFCGGPVLSHPLPLSLTHSLRTPWTRRRATSAQTRQHSGPDGRHQKHVITGDTRHHRHSRAGVTESFIVALVVPRDTIVHWGGGGGGRQWESVFTLSTSQTCSHMALATARSMFFLGGFQSFLGIRPRDAQAICLQQSRALRTQAQIHLHKSLSH